MSGNATERAIAFGCDGERLLGILHVPSAPASTGVVVVVGGPQYRAGSHRQFVQLARALANAGHPVLRFDCRGMGDSTGELRNFEGMSPDIGAAIDAMQEHLPFVERVAVWGLCDGASAALLYCDDTMDPRVAGLCLLNPWVRSDASLAKTQIKHYYGQRLLQPQFWDKLLKGRVSLSAVQDFLRNLRTAREKPQHAPREALAPTFQQRMARAWKRFNGPLLLLLSGNDYTAKEFIEHARTDEAWKGLLEHPTLESHDLPGADHTFSATASRLAAEGLFVAWVHRLSGHQGSTGTALQYR